MMNDGAFTFRREQRLGGKEAFAAVYEARVREGRFPVTIYSRPNEREGCRLGISVSRQVGTAPRRNRIKRLLREAFRLSQHEIQAGYDFVVVVRPHEPKELGEYRELLKRAAAKMHEEWGRK